MCYIQGGTPAGATTDFPGCLDKTGPKEDRHIIIPYELYFSKESPTWENKGVAFIKSTKNDKTRTLGRMYQITSEQFKEIVRQENFGNITESHIEIDFDALIKNGELELLAGWYSRIIHLGFEEDLPIFTFTAAWPDDRIELNPPGENYLGIIIRGLIETYDPPILDLIDYIYNSEGIKGLITKEEIVKIITTI
jgi:hypothetical protein